MSKLEEIIKYNESFVGNKDYQEYVTTKIPKKKMAILSCMDTRLTELLPKAMNIKNGDAKNNKRCRSNSYAPIWWRNEKYISCSI